MSLTSHPSSWFSPTAFPINVSLGIPGSICLSQYAEEIHKKKWSAVGNGGYTCLTISQLFNVLTLLGMLF